MENKDFMSHLLILERDWRYRHRKRGVQLVKAGCYFVPADITREYANRAVLEGMGKLRLIERVEEPTATVVSVAFGTETPEFIKPKKKRGRPKKVAPENKIISAPENKASMA